MIRPKVDASAKIVSVTLVGDYAVDFDPGSAAQPLPPDRVILGSQDLGLTGVATELAERADSILLGAQSIVNQRTGEQLRATLTALEGTLKATQRTMQIYANPDEGPTAELTKTMAAFRQLSARLDSTLVAFRSDTISANLAAMTAQLTSTTGRLDTLLAGMNRGQGTLGKFVTDSGLYYDMRELSQGMKNLIAELAKNPGKIPVTVKLF
jgi:phospholipid/cholesterol/gamma-HCH transport system substrate-binding protein